MLAAVVPANDEEARFPIGVTGHQICLSSDGCLMFLTGGWSPDAPIQEGASDPHFVPTVWRYNVLKNSWTQLRSPTVTMPVEIASHCMLYLNERRLLHFGGSLNAIGQSRCSNCVYIYHIREEQWSELSTNGDLPPGNLGHWFGQAAVLQRDLHGDPCTLYVASGKVGSPSNDETLIHSLNLRSYNWTQLSPVEPGDHTPRGRIRHSIVLWLNNLYLFGGSAEFSSRPFALQTINVFNIDNREWTQMHTLPDLTHAENQPYPMSAFGCVLYKDDVYISGGCAQTPIGYRVCADVWRLHLPTMKWTHYTTLPLPVWFHDADVDQFGRMIIMGGCITTRYGRRDQRTNIVQRILLDTPPLKQLAIEAVALLCYTREVRPSDLGLPRDLLLPVQRCLA